MTVRCRVCHRVEQWSADGTRTVRTEGGGRRPPSPERATFEVLAASARGELGPVVARCPACGAPLVADGAAVRIPWTLPTPQGPIVLADDGTMSPPPEVAERWVAESWPVVVEEDSKAFRLFRSSLVMMMLAPVAVWLLAVFFVVLFLSNFGAPVPFP